MAGRAIIFAFSRLFAVTALWFIGLLVWNLSAASLRTMLSVVGLLRVVIGALCIVGALIFLYVSFPGMTEDEFSVFAIGTFLAALTADFLIGDDIRKRLGA